MYAEDGKGMNACGFVYYAKLCMLPFFYFFFFFCFSCFEGWKCERRTGRLYTFGAIQGFGGERC